MFLPGTVARGLDADRGGHVLEARALDRVQQQRAAVGRRDRDVRIPVAVVILDRELVAMAAAW